MQWICNRSSGRPLYRHQQQMYHTMLFRAIVYNVGLSQLSGIWTTDKRNLADKNGRYWMCQVTLVCDCASLAIFIWSFSALCTPVNRTKRMASTFCCCSYLLEYGVKQFELSFVPIIRDTEHATSIADRKLHTDFSLNEMQLLSAHVVSQQFSLLVFSFYFSGVFFLSVN